VDGPESRDSGPFTIPCNFLGSQHRTFRGADFS
jgi:hypothetical protein